MWSSTAFGRARLIKPLWHFHQGHARVSLMSTIAEIEAAIELLSPQQVEELAIWLNSLRAAGETSVGRCVAEPGRGAARPGVTSAEVLALTRHEG